MPAVSKSPSLTVQFLLNQPTLIARGMTSLVNKKLKTDQLFVRGTPEQVAGGAMRYQELESLYLDADAEELAEGADFPITDWSEIVKTALVRNYGFGFRITNLAIRRNQRDMITRGSVKLANGIAKKIDLLAMSVLEDTVTFPAIQTSAAGSLWAVGTANLNILNDLLKAEEKLETKDNGYSGFENATLIVHPLRRKDLINDALIAGRLPRETPDSSISTGVMSRILGLRDIVYTPQITATKAILMDTDIAGVIADEAPHPSEGWVSDTPAGEVAPVYVKVDQVGNPPVHKAVYAGRWPAIALVQPDAVCIITGVA